MSPPAMFSESLSCVASCTRPLRPMAHRADSTTRPRLRVRAMNSAPPPISRAIVTAPRRSRYAREPRPSASSCTTGSRSIHRSTAAIASPTGPPRFGVRHVDADQACSADAAIASSASAHSSRTIRVRAVAQRDFFWHRGQSGKFDGRFLLARDGVRPPSRKVRPAAACQSHR